MRYGGEKAFDQAGVALVGGAAGGGGGKLAEDGREVEEIGGGAES